MSGKDSVLYSKMKKHEFVTFKMFDLTAFLDEEELIIELCLERLKRLSEPSSADGLLSIFHETINIFQNIILINGKAGDITADVQIPMMLCIVIRSRVRNLYTIMDFIEMFCY